MNGIFRNKELEQDLYVNRPSVQVTYKNLSHPHNQHSSQCPPLFLQYGSPLSVELQDHHISKSEEHERRVE